MHETHPLHLAKVFCTLSLADLNQVAALARTADYKANQLVLQAGCSPEHVVVVVSGGLHVVDVLDDGRLCHVGTLRPGDSLGWISAIDALPTASHIIAADDLTRVYFVPLTVIRALLSQRPAFSKAVMATLASTIRHYMRTRAALSAPSVAQRIYRVILGLAQDAGQQAGTPAVPLPKQQDLANLANTSRETVSRTLQELIRSGVLHKQGHQVTIANLPALQRLAGQK